MCFVYVVKLRTMPLGKDEIWGKNIYFTFNWQQPKWYTLYCMIKIKFCTEKQHRYFVSEMKNNKAIVLPNQIRNIVPLCLNIMLVWLGKSDSEMVNKMFVGAFNFIKRKVSFWKCKGEESLQGDWNEVRVCYTVFEFSKKCWKEVNVKDKETYMTELWSITELLSI